MKKNIFTQGTFLHHRFVKLVRSTFLSGLVGLLAGVAASIFLFALDMATQFRLENIYIIFGLPFAGLLIGWVYHRFGREVASGNNLILDEIHDPKKVVPFRMAPLILGGTVLTHLFGGSAGREGTAVQMGASMADQLNHFFKIEIAERKILLAAGAGAGFGAAIGTPWAGTIFGMEVIHVGKLKLFAWLECLIASFFGYYTAIILQAPHSEFTRISSVTLDLKTAFFVAIAGICFGLAARFFSSLTHLIEKANVNFVSYPPLRPFWGGLALMLLFLLSNNIRYSGLGIEHIQTALREPTSFFDPFLKMLFTALTVGSGFKGGEFIPLVFIGTTLGSALASVFPVALSLLAALGFAAVFAGAANAPIACSLMAIEIFGAPITPYAILACFFSYYVSGYNGIYKSQKILMKKGQILKAYLLFFGELPMRFLSFRK